MFGLVSCVVNIAAAGAVDRLFVHISETKRKPPLSLSSTELPKSFPLLILIENWYFEYILNKVSIR